MGQYLHRILNHQTLPIETVYHNGHVYIHSYWKYFTPGSFVDAPADTDLIVEQLGTSPVGQITAIFKIKIKHNAKISNR
jgi:hypothetical protein